MISPEGRSRSPEGKTISSIYVLPHSIRTTSAALAQSGRGGAAVQAFSFF